MSNVTPPPRHGRGPSSAGLDNKAAKPQPEGAGAKKGGYSHYAGGQPSPASGPSLVSKLRGVLGGAGSAYAAEGDIRSRLTFIQTMPSSDRARELQSLATALAEPSAKGDRGAFFDHLFALPDAPGFVGEAARAYCRGPADAHKPLQRFEELLANVFARASDAYDSSKAANLLMVLHSCVRPAMETLATGGYAAKDVATLLTRTVRSCPELGLVLGLAAVGTGLAEARTAVQSRREASQFLEDCARAFLTSQATSSETGSSHPNTWLLCGLSKPVGLLKKQLDVDQARDLLRRAFAHEGSWQELLPKLPPAWKSLQNIPTTSSAIDSKSSSAPPVKDRVDQPKPSAPPLDLDEAQFLTQVKHQPIRAADFKNTPVVAMGEPEPTFDPALARQIDDDFRKAFADPAAPNFKGLREAMKQWRSDQPRDEGRRMTDANLQYLLRACAAIVGDPKAERPASHYGTLMGLVLEDVLGGEGIHAMDLLATAAIVFSPEHAPLQQGDPVEACAWVGWAVKAIMGRGEAKSIHEALKNAPGDIPVQVAFAIASAVSAPDKENANRPAWMIEGSDAYKLAGRALTTLRTRDGHEQAVFCFVSMLSNPSDQSARLTEIPLIDPGKVKWMLDEQAPADINAAVNELVKKTRPRRPSERSPQQAVQPGFVGMLPGLVRNPPSHRPFVAALPAGADEELPAAIEPGARMPKDALVSVLENLVAKGSIKEVEGAIKPLREDLSGEEWADLRDAFDALAVPGAQRSPISSAMEAAIRAQLDLRA